MSRILKQVTKWSLESEEAALQEPLTEEEEATLAEAEVESEQLRQDVEQAVEEADRFEAVADELQQQEEAAAIIAEQNDGVLPAEAGALVEAGRRIAVASLGIDPESEEGQELVDSASVESMCDAEAKYFSLEADDENRGSTMKKIKEHAKQIWQWIKEKIAKFMAWLDKVTTIIPKKFASIRNEIKALSAEEYAAKVKALGDKDCVVIRGGKPIEVGVKNVTTAFSVAIAKNSIVTSLLSTKSDEEIDAAFAKLAEQHKSFNGQEITIYDTVYQVICTDLGVLKLNVKTELEAGKFSALSQADMVKLLEVGTLSFQTFLTARKQLDKNKGNVEKIVNGAIDHKPVRAINDVYRTQFAIISKAQQSYNALISAGNAILSAKVPEAALPAPQA